MNNTLFTQTFVMSNQKLLLQTKVSQIFLELLQSQNIDINLQMPSHLTFLVNPASKIRLQFKHLSFCAVKDQTPLTSFAHVY
jgi:hypothetical protein